MNRAADHRGVTLGLGGTQLDLEVAGQFGDFLRARRSWSRRHSLPVAEDHLVVHGPKVASVELESEAEQVFLEPLYVHRPGYFEDLDTAPGNPDAQPVFPPWPAPD